LIVIIYVVDGCIIGTPEAIKEAIKALSKSFKVKTRDEMNKFAGCNIIDTIDKDGVWIPQPKLLMDIKSNFMDLIKENANVFQTPSAPTALIILPFEGNPLILT
jgi:hypothetical protein